MHPPQPLVYVAGPLTGGHYLENVARAIDVAHFLSGCRILAFIPHAHSMVWKLRFPQHGRDFWMKYDFEMIRRCDGLVRIIGESPGADEEEALAKELGLPVTRIHPSLPLSKELTEFLAAVRARVDS